MKSAPGALPGSAPGKSRSGGVNFLNVLDVIIILAYFVGMIVLGLIANKNRPAWMTIIWAAARWAL